VARAGLVKIRLAAFDAAVSARWAERWRPPPTLAGLVSESSQEQGLYRAQELARLLRKFASRKRSGGVFDEHEFVLPKELAAWLADKVRSGAIFVNLGAQYLLPSVRHLCIQCELRVVYARRGRPRLSGRSLAATLEKEHMCERHRKRLRSRARKQITWRTLGDLAA
jgi:hypothetical protein